MKLLVIASRLSFDGPTLLFDRSGLRLAGFGIFFGRFQLAFAGYDQKLAATELSRSDALLMSETERADCCCCGVRAISDGVATITGADRWIADRDRLYCNPPNFSADRPNIAAGRINPWPTVLSGSDLFLDDRDRTS
jgi:hypothetical protein